MRTYFVQYFAPLLFQLLLYPTQRERLFTLQLYEVMFGGGYYDMPLAVRSFNQPVGSPWYETYFVAGYASYPYLLVCIIL